MKYTKMDMIAHTPEAVKSQPDVTMSDAQRMLPETRRQRIVQALRESSSGSMPVSELAGRFGVSQMTIRRDLDWLQARLLVKRVHGGAMLHDVAAPEKPFTKRSHELGLEKQAIGKRAAELAHEGETIILDAGTTTREIARHLASVEGLTVITHALPIAQDLAKAPQITTILLGGLLKTNELCTIGPTVTRELAQLSADRVFLSVAGFDAVKGLTDSDLHEAAVKEAMIRAAAEVVLVADSSKWRQASLARVADLEAVNILVTDEGLDSEAIAALKAQGIQVIIAPASGDTRDTNTP